MLRAGFCRILTGDAPRRRPARGGAADASARGAGLLGAERPAGPAYVKLAAQEVLHIGTRLTPGGGYMTLRRSQDALTITQNSLLSLSG